MWLILLIYIFCVPIQSYISEVVKIEHVIFTLYLRKLKLLRVKGLAKGHLVPK